LAEGKDENESNDNARFLKIIYNPEDYCGETE
jgi:hypothetical protein